METRLGRVPEGDPVNRRLAFDFAFLEGDSRRGDERVVVLVVIRERPRGRGFLPEFESLVRDGAGRDNREDRRGAISAEDIDNDASSTAMASVPASVAAGADSWRRPNMCNIGENKFISVEEDDEDFEIGLGAELALSTTRSRSGSPEGAAAASVVLPRRRGASATDTVAVGVDSDASWGPRDRRARDCCGDVRIKAPPGLTIFGVFGEEVIKSGASSFFRRFAAGAGSVDYTTQARIGVKDAFQQKEV